VAYLNLRDGGFGDADGIENGIIVDPLAFGLSAESGAGSRALKSDGHNNSSDSTCFISTAACRPGYGQSTKLRWREILALGLSILFILGLMVYFSGETRS
jgi:hypothetical protein